MGDRLHFKTEQAIKRLSEGQTLTIGGTSFGPLNTEEIRLLSILAKNRDTLIEERGIELAKHVMELFGEKGVLERQEPRSPAPISMPGAWRLFSIQASCFRGLAPANVNWSHEFTDGKSFLLYGPNGCGKSSVLGAIIWCFTGYILRDDCAPSAPQDVPVYSAGRRPSSAGSRPDALTLTDEFEQNTAPEKEYWVEVEIVAGDKDTQQHQWLRRHSIDGLFKSSDKTNWSPIRSIEQAGISELDAELHLLMPARVAHLSFGKDTDLVRLFSQIVGLDDLEDIANLAASAHSALVREANKTEHTVESEDEKLAKIISSLKDSGLQSLRSLRAFDAAMTPARTSENIKEFGLELKNLVEQQKGELARDLGIRLPEEDSNDYASFKEHLDNLPGQVQVAIDQLGKPVSAIFPTSIGLNGFSDSELAETTAKLEKFEEGARQKVQERLAWARQEADDEKLSLMLVAAEHYREGSSSCPVCTQDLSPVPHVRRQLEELHLKANRQHLKKTFDDLELALIKDLDEIVSRTRQSEGIQTLSQRILSDWETLKSARFPGLLRGIAETFDGAIAELSQLPGSEPVKEPTSFLGNYKDQFPEAFARLHNSLGAAYRYMQLARSLVRWRDQLTKALVRVLQQSHGQGPDCVATIITRGRKFSNELNQLKDALKQTRDLFASQKNCENLVRQVENYRRVAAATDKCKALGQLVRQEVCGAVKQVEPSLKKNYECLCKEHLFPLDLLTAGNAANPSVKNEINAYFKIGTERVPIGPFSNAGRLRALALSFIFALLKKSSGSLGILICDDPALSLDDEHKARFVDDLVKPLLDRMQVILATHYENFYKVAEPIFGRGERLQMPPRRRACDIVAFEPGDLLQRVEESLRAPTCSWREASINLRRWAERSLQTLSGYCPSPFINLKDFPASVTNYGKIVDPGVATDGRNKIVSAFQNPKFSRIVNRTAHDEEPSEAEVRDGLDHLKVCRKVVDKEIELLKSNYRHHLLDRAIAPRPTLEILPLEDSLPDLELRIAGAAAASRNGAGVTWGAEAIIQLSGYSVALVKFDTLAPIAMPGQYLLLDPTGSPPANSDLVVVECENRERFARRIWIDKTRTHIQLEAANITRPYPPLTLTPGLSFLRRVTGVLFHGPKVTIGKLGEEWVAPSGVTSGLFAGVIGIRVEGTCLEPIARDGQIVLVKHSMDISSVRKAALMCVDSAEIGAVIKRCYPGNDEWILTPVNPIDLEDPIRIPVAEILHVYPIVGVLFEHNFEMETLDLRKDEAIVGTQG